MTHFNRKLMMTLWVFWIVLIFQVPVQAKDYIFVPTVKGLDVVDCETGAVIEGARYSDYVMNASYSPDGSRYYLNAYHSIFAVDTETFKLVDTYKFSTDLSRVTIFSSAVSNNGKQLYLSCQIVKKKQNIPKLNVLPPQFIIFDIDKQEMVKNYEVPYGAHGIFPIRNDPDHVILFALDVYKMNLKTVFGECYKSNPAVDFWFRLTEKYEGYKTILPNRKYWNGTYYDGLFFSIDGEAYAAIQRARQEVQ